MIKKVRFLVTPALLVAPVLALGQTTTGGALDPSDVDLSTPINNLTTFSWGVLSQNATALFGLAAVFVGVAIVIGLVKKFIGI